MSEYDSIVRHSEAVIRHSKHYSQKEKTHNRILRLHEAIHDYLDQHQPQNLGIHVTDGVKPEMKKA